MKMNSLFWGGLVFLIVFMMWVEYNLPRSFVWEPTFSMKDKQPFGCAVFDDVLSHSLRQGYEVTDETLYLLSLDKLPKRNILSVSKRIDLTLTDFEALMELLEAGDNVLLAASRFSGVLSDTFALHASYDYLDYEELARQVLHRPSRDTFVWSEPFAGESFDFYSAFRGVDFIRYDSLFVPVVVPGEERMDSGVRLASVIRAQIGEGELILMTMPLLFTNYGMLDRDNSDQIFRLLSLMGDRPLVRTEAYARSARQNDTPLRYFLTHPPLRWGVYMTMLVLLLFMIFTARRRQRVIPVMQQPVNKRMEFTELIGTLYFRRRDNAGLVRKKYIFFAETLRRVMQVDVEDESQHLQTVDRIAGKTGIGTEKISALLIRLRHVYTQEIRLTDEQMKQHIDEMNEIINHLYI
ncbi:MAG: DUF4350 domain-containing protein [Bacteroides sp.]|nr:DUF4350 domain-containing protein [Bacteroides sp.]